MWINRKKCITTGPIFARVKNIYYDIKVIKVCWQMLSHVKYVYYRFSQDKDNIDFTRTVNVTVFECGTFHLLSDTLMGKIGVQLILHVKVSFTIDKMLNVDCHVDRYGCGTVTCKQTFFF